MKPGFVLAGMKNINYRTEKIILDQREKLILYTDGVTEATNQELQMYRSERLIEILKQSSKRHAEEMIEQIIESIEVFVNGAVLIVTYYLQHQKP